MTRHLSVPFSATLLGLIGLIVVPLAAALFGLGAATVDSLEHRSVRQRMAALADAVEDFLSNGLDVIVSVGAAMADGPSFQRLADDGLDDTRLRQLVAVLGRHSLAAAAYVGYADGHFLYAGNIDSLSQEQREDYGYGAPLAKSVIVRTIADTPEGRRETWWFQLPDGSETARRTRPSEYDPRKRLWYIEAVGAKQAALTDPYVFASADVVGISAGVPLAGGRGAFGFDITLDNLSALITTYKITPNSIIMVGNKAGSVVIQSKACAPLAADCLPGGGGARLALAAALRETAGTKRIQKSITSDGHDYELYVVPTEPMLGQRFVVAAAVPLVELAADSRALLQDSALAAAAAIALAILAALAGSLVLSRPLSRIASVTERIRRLDFSGHAPVASRISEVQQLARSVEHMRDGLEVFGRYVSRGLVERIMRAEGGASRRGVRRDLTVMFTDVEGFSRIAETLPPEVLTRRLSHYFEALGSAIASNNGTIDKYIGDSIMAYWNAPEPDADHLAHACRAALQVAAASRNLAAKWHARGRPAFRTRIGVHTGTAVVGDVGTKERINYTLVGTVANQASRLEGLNKVYGTDVLVSGEVVATVADRFVWRLVDRVVPAGTTEMHDIYEPLGEISDAAAYAAFLTPWQDGHTAYTRGDFGAALRGFRAAQAHRPNDGPARVLVHRCEMFLHQGPPENWDGGWHFEKK